MTTLVADDLGPVFGLGAITREVAFLVAVVAGDVCSRTRLGTFTSHVSRVVAVLADDDSGIGAFVLAVAMVVLSRMQTTLGCLACLPDLAAVEAGSGLLSGLGAFLGHVTS